MPKHFYLSRPHRNIWLVFIYFCQPCGLEEIFRWLFGAAAAVGTHVRLMPSGYVCSCCAFRVLRPWSSYAGTLASKRPHFTIERVACCDRGVYIGRTVAGITFCWFFIFLPRGGVSKNCLGRQFGIWCRSSGGKQTWYAEGLCSSVLCFSRVATVKILCSDVGPPRGRILQLRGLNVATMAFTQYVLLQESFFVVLPFFLPRNGHRRNPATGNENLGLELAKLF